MNPEPRKAAGPRPRAPRPPRSKPARERRQCSSLCSWLCRDSFLRRVRTALLHLSRAARLAEQRLCSWMCSWMCSSLRSLLRSWLRNSRVFISRNANVFPTLGCRNSYRSRRHKILDFLRASTSEPCPSSKSAHSQPSLL